MADGKKTQREGDGMLVQAKAENHRGSGGGNWKNFRAGERERTEARLDVHEQITARILEKLAQGTVPWQSPSIARVGLPRNFSTGKAYRGINVFLLAMADFQSPYFLTFLQAKDLGGNVRKGEKGFPVVKAGTWEPKDGESTAKSEQAEEDDEAGKRKFLRAYTVFNACQIDGIEFPEVLKSEEYTPSQQAEAARLMIAEMPNPPAIFEGRRATPHYIPRTDTVEMPTRDTFRAEWRFYKTLFHEIGHSTGHMSRLNRRTLVENQGAGAAGEENHKIYSEEELVAEMTAAFLGAHAGIIEDDFDNSAAYLKGWMDALHVKDHKKWLIRAASEAQKAVDYVLNTKS